MAGLCPAWPNPVRLASEPDATESSEREAQKEEFLYKPRVLSA